MRQGMMLSAGLLLLGASGASAQFASERGTPTPFGGGQPAVSAPPPARPQTLTTPALPAGLQAMTPAGGANAAAPAHRNSISAVSSTTNLEMPPHPWSVKPEHGAWMICVRGYTGADSCALAERFCQEIRETHKVAAYIYSRNAEELRRERAKVEAIRRAEIEKQQPFLQVLAEAEKKAIAEGRPFQHTPVKIRHPKPYHESPEQWAVLIGGFKDDKAARDALNIVRKMPPPKDVSLLDPIVSESVNADRTATAEGTYLNPFASAMVVPNPAIARAVAEEKFKLEPFVVKINEEGKYNLLKATKPWTLRVKSFSTPMRIAGKDGDGETVFARTMNVFSSKKSMLEVTAEQAEQLAESLRDPKMAESLQYANRKPETFESYVLHHRTGSLVCVGQFDSPDDPELIRIQNLLQSMTFKVKETDKSNIPRPAISPATETQRMFDSVTPMPVPRQ